MKRIAKKLAVIALAAALFAAAATADPVPIYSENFDDGIADDWEVTGGIFDVTDGVYTSWIGYGYTFHENPAGDDFVINLRARLDRGWGYGIFFRADAEARSGYTFQYDPGYGSGKLLLRRWEDGNESVLYQADFEEDWYGMWRDIAIRAEGDNIVVNLDGAEVFNVIEDEFHGSDFGLRTWGLSKTAFDDISIANIGHSTGIPEPGTLPMVLLSAAGLSFAAGCLRRKTAKLP